MKIFGGSKESFVRIILATDDGIDRWMVNQLITEYARLQDRYQISTIGGDILIADVTKSDVAFTAKCHLCPYAGRPRGFAQHMEMKHRLKIRHKPHPSEIAYFKELTAFAIENRSLPHDTIVKKFDESTVKT